MTRKSGKHLNSEQKSMTAENQAAETSIPERQSAELSVVQRQSGETSGAESQTAAVLREGRQTSLMSSVETAQKQSEKATAESGSAKSSALRVTAAVNLSAAKTETADASNGQIEKTAEGCESGDTTAETENAAKDEAAEKERADAESARKAHRKYSAWQKFNLVRNVLALAFYCFYCIYFIYHKQGNQVVNYILMGSTAVYFLLFVVTALILGRKGKRFTGASKRVYKMTRRLTLLINTILTGGAIINMNSFESGLMIRVCAFIMIGNFALNVVWLILSPKIAKKYSEQITNIKSNAKSFWGGLKSLYKKGFAKEAEISAKSKTAVMNADADNTEQKCVDKENGGGTDKICGAEKGGAEENLKKTGGENRAGGGAGAERKTAVKISGREEDEL